MLSIDHLKICTLLFAYGVCFVTLFWFGGGGGLLLGPSSSAAVPSDFPILRTTVRSPYCVHIEMQIESDGCNEVDKSNSNSKSVRGTPKNSHSVNSSTTSSSNNCEQYKKLLTKCQSAVKVAFQHINLGGCSYENKLNTMCQMEWCNDSAGRMRISSSSSTTNSCHEECTQVHQNLNDCINRNVHNYMKKYGVL